MIICLICILLSFSVSFFVTNSLQGNADQEIIRLVNLNKKILRTSHENILDKIKFQIKYTFFLSGPHFVQFIYSTRAITWSVCSLVFGLSFQAEYLHFLNNTYINSLLLIFGIIGFVGWLINSFKCNFIFITFSIMYYGWIAWTLLLNHNIMGSTNFFFEMFVVIWLAFRIQHDELIGRYYKEFVVNKKE